jgi:hypothetical protein
VWVADVHSDDIIPRGYDLSAPQETQAFIDDFRFQKAECWLKSVYKKMSGLDAPAQDELIVQEGPVLYCILYCTVLYTVLYCTVLYFVLYCTTYCTVYCTVLCTVLYCVLYCTVYCTVLCTVLYCVLYCTVLCCTVLYCTVLYSDLSYAPLSSLNPPPDIPLPFLLFISLPPLLSQDLSRVAMSTQ